MKQFCAALIFASAFAKGNSTTTDMDLKDDMDHMDHMDHDDDMMMDHSDHSKLDMAGQMVDMFCR